MDYFTSKEKEALVEMLAHYEGVLTDKIQKKRETEREGLEDKLEIISRCAAKVLRVPKKVGG